MSTKRHRSRGRWCAAALVTTLSLALWGGQSAVEARQRTQGPALRASLRTELNDYLTTRSVAEHISAVSLAVTFRGQRPSIDLAVGTTRYGGGSRLSTNSLWQIGSNTKAFTSVMLLQLEAEHQLSIYDRLGKWLPRYPAWRHITIKQLLNMTSGIQDYSDQSAFLRTYAAAPSTEFSLSRLVSYVAGLPLLKGFNYSNTNYVLAQMIIERATHDTYADQLRRRIIRPLHLQNLFYSPTGFPAAVSARMPAGYFLIPELPLLAPLLGQDLSRENLSYGPGSGGIVSSLQDMTKWDRALYDGRELPRKQQGELESLVSRKTGKPIRMTTLADPAGFGLGLGQQWSSTLGTAWFYEGETYAFRVLHIYSPRSGTIIAVGLNSATTPPANDKIAALGASVYQILHNAGVS